MLKRDFHLKGSECIGAEFAVVTAVLSHWNSVIVLGPAKI